jgi:hypothetical protein
VARQNAAPEPSSAILAVWRGGSTAFLSINDRLLPTREYDIEPTMASVYSHARELRTLGQQLDKQGIDIFELSRLDGDYVVDCADPNPPFTDLIHLQFSAVELESLELAAARARTPGFTQVNFQSMAETLRATGRYVDRLNAKLLTITAPDNVSADILFKIEYQTRDGPYHSEEIHTNDLAELAIRMYKERVRIHNPRARSAT